VVGIPGVADCCRCRELRKRIAGLGRPSPFGHRCTRFWDFGLNSFDPFLQSQIRSISKAVDY
jgi:hypothetical protein